MAAPEPETFSIDLNGDTVSCVGDPGVDVSKCLEAKMFKDWAANVEKRFQVKTITFQSLDMFGPRPGFIKFKADCVNRSDGKFIPGIVFMRGHSVGMLMVLTAAETGKLFTVLVVQPRLPTPDFESAEIPAGMMDGDGNFTGVAVKEIAEETGITVGPDQLKPLGGGRLVPISCGGSDEAMRFFLYEDTVPQAKIELLQGRLQGVLEEGEQITVKVVPFEEIYKLNDCKSLVVLALYLTKDSQ